MNFVKVNLLLERETHQAVFDLFHAFAVHGFSYPPIAQYVHGPVVFTMAIDSQYTEVVMTKHRRGDNEFQTWVFEIPDDYNISLTPNLIENGVDIVNQWDSLIDMLMEYTE